MPRHGVVHIFVQGSSAWTVGHPKQRYCGNLSMACWSSKGVSAWPAGRPSPACLNTRTFVLTSASSFYPFLDSAKQRLKVSHGPTGSGIHMPLLLFFVCTPHKGCTRNPILSNCCLQEGQMRLIYITNLSTNIRMDLALVPYTSYASAKYPSKSSEIDRACVQYRLSGNSKSRASASDRSDSSI